jgi:hypothetical protein
MESRQRGLSSSLTLTLIEAQVVTLLTKLYFFRHGVEVQETNRNFGRRVSGCLVCV